jgi:hypothetical protein
MAHDHYALGTGLGTPSAAMTVNGPPWMWMGWMKGSPPSGGDLEQSEPVAADDVVSRDEPVSGSRHLA